MGFNIPIQERDTVDLQNAPQVQAQNQQLITPFKEGFTKPIDEFAAAAEKQAGLLKIKAYNFAKQKFENDRDSLIDGGIQKVTSAQGENSFTEADKVQKRLPNDINQLVQKIPEEYRAEFTNLANEGLRRYDKVSLGHQYRQQNLLINKTEKERGAYLTDQIAQSALNPEKFQEQMNELDRLVDTSMRRQLGGADGGPISKELQNAIDYHKQESGSLAITKAIETMVSSDMIDSAFGFANKYKDRITSQDSVKVNALLKKGRGNKDLDMARALISEAEAAKPGQPQAQRKYIKDHAPNGEILYTTLEKHSSQVSFDNQQRNENLQRWQASAQDAILKSKGDPAAIDRILKNSDMELRPRLTAYANDVVSGKEVVTKPAVFAYLQNTYINQSEKFGDPNQVNLEAYKADINKVDLDNFRAKQKELSDPLTSRMGNNKFQYIADRFMKNNLDRKSNGRLTDESEVEQVRLQTIWDETYRNVKANMPDKSSESDIAKELEKEFLLKVTGGKELKFWEKAVNVAGSVANAALDSDLLHIDKITAIDPSNRTGLIKNPVHYEQVKRQLAAAGKDTSEENVLRELKNLYIQHPELQ